jgi:lipoate-protein ligase A
MNQTSISTKETVFERDEYPTATWRLIMTPPAAGAWNMAVDEALLESVGLEMSAPILRLYAWRPACLSLGYSQSIQDIDHVALSRNGWDLVRRPTGGKAILHTDEITYSVIAPGDEPRLVGGVLESYQRLSQALLVALLDLHIPASSAPLKVTQKRTPEGPVCFEVPSKYEITVNGRKLIGSAQARRKAGVLQHGSLPLHGDLGRILKGLKFETESQRQAAEDRLQARAITLEQTANRRLKWDEVAAAFIRAFRYALNLSFEAIKPTQDELLRAQELVNRKYAHSDWTGRV